MQSNCLDVYYTIIFRMEYDVEKLRVIISSSLQAVRFLNCVVVFPFSHNARRNFLGRTQDLTALGYFRSSGSGTSQDDAQLRHTSGNPGSDLAGSWRRWIVSEAESGTRVDAKAWNSAQESDAASCACAQSHRPNRPNPITRGTPPTRAAPST